MVKKKKLFAINCEPQIKQYKKINFFTHICQETKIILKNELSIQLMQSVKKLEQNQRNKKEIKIRTDVREI